jgi:Lrp/AsnC family transcriptional regulator for asnA, asnC and gidA
MPGSWHDSTTGDKGIRGKETQLQRTASSKMFQTMETIVHNVRMTRERSKPAPALDEVSKAIIEQLQADGRRSYAAIGKVVGLSEAAVRQRVQRLTDSGVMQVVAVTDPLQLGFARQAMVGVKVTGPLDPVADALAALPQVDYVVITAGSFDILIEVVCESDQDLLDLISSHVRTIPGVLSTETFMYLRLHTQSYNWGVR